MKELMLLVFMSTLWVTATAQNSNRFPPVDKSPMDMSYYPVNYPILRIQPGAKPTDPLVARVIYSRPQKMGRKVFGELVEDGKIWRLGANEATEIEFFREVKIGTKKIKKGRYTLYAIENKDRWTLILNTETDTWGAFGYDASKDVLRVDCAVQKTPETIEAFTMSFEKAGERTIRLLIAWEDAMVTLPVQW
ncbi:MAG TPA: DUF2911 domain-containing protein [Lacibacter sp.]|nr:DUF2911 domain-containing protein [Lacibacter sp.]HMO88454.1 DUF2911 domain-containing protein [Lacibacter sp.]HMP86635.1 DUF2911 domain-containing protein [Lacibacter sp.]